MAFSTVATLSLVNSDGCESCTYSGAGYEYWDSESIHRLVDKKQAFHLEGYSAEGVIVEDDVRLSFNATSAIKQFPFLLVSKWS